jgi:hypothetical protein
MHVAVHISSTPPLPSRAVACSALLNTGHTHTPECSLLHCLQSKRGALSLNHPHQVTATGLVLTTGETVPVDSLVAALGNGAPTFPYLPQAMRDVLEGQPGGVQL